MKELSKAATRTMDKLTAGMGEVEHRRIDNREGTFMAAVVETVGKTPFGAQIISVAHYYEECGDLMRDPEMEFWKVGGSYYPVSYQLDSLAVYQISAYINHEDGKLMVASRMQRNHASFANTWMRNIKEQQML